jgi:biopolymer transport protein ExbB
MILNFLLLQAQATVAAISNPDVQKISFLQLFKEGGVLMIPLLLCSLLLVYVFVERWMAINKASGDDKLFMPLIKERILSNNLAEARSLCNSNNSAVARIIEKGINRTGKPIDQIERAMEATGKLEVYKMEKNLSILSTLAGIAPMFGFLGTIAGMIILFFNVQHQGFSLESIAGGIYTKMVTSAVGLIIGLLAYVAHSFLNAQINKNVHKLEAAAVEFIDILQDTHK